ncbi:MAG: hypothetical protein AMJ72_12295 [Acidithiobacillales bacterium SM1_46]|nr:MAG: hypothetical protein AMJ72_12295 [Acidithiobacillales bacterium SM1_46]
MTVRIAIAATGKTKEVAQYLPNNYKVIGRTCDNTGTIIVGVDNAGWTMDDYVIPRLGSGMIYCEEVVEIDGLDLKQLLLQLEPTPPPKKGRKRALDDHQVEEVRHAWSSNDREWQEYRKRPCGRPPHHLTISDLARRFRVSEGVIADIINREGAYA